MGYLRDNPVFHHLLVLERADALWLVPDDTGSWTLPGFVSKEQHTAEVELVARHMRARYGLAVSLLGAVATECDAAATRGRPAGLAEALTDTATGSRWWSRPAVAAGEVPLCED